MIRFCCARFRCGWTLPTLSVAGLSAASLNLALIVGLAACAERQANWDDLNEQAARALSAGRSIEAEGHLQAALELARGSGEAAHRLPLSLHRLARFYEARQRYSQAAEYYQLALAEDSKRLQVGDPALWDTVKRLAGMHENLQQITQAKEVYKAFLGAQEASLGHDALPLATTLVQVGRLSRMRGAYDEAEKSLQRALSIRIRHLGQDNDELPEILDEYVALLRETEQPYKADLMEERAANLRMKRTARVLGQTR